MKKKKVVKKEDKNLKDVENQLARALADYDNLRKRVEREKEELEKLAGIKFAIKILTIFDMLEGKRILKK
jgi:molecular chaperone GrpE (heat shock protein)